jgi:ABC-2 type transport system permease protein
MRKFIYLLKVNLRVNFGLSSLKHRLFVEKKDTWVVPLIALSLLGIIPLFLGYLRVIKGLYQGLEMMNQQYAVLTMAIMMGQLIILVFGTYYMMAAFYFSKDLEILVPLPLRPYQIMASKFGVILVNEYLTVLPIVAPVFIYYGILSKASLGYWLLSLCIYILLPIIPMAISAILVIIMMRFVNVSRKKDFLVVVGSLLLLTFILAVQLGMNRLMMRGGEEKIIKMLMGEDGIIKLIGNRFPPSVWASKAMAFGFSAKGLGNFFGFAALSGGLLAGLLIIGEKLFYQGLIGGREFAAKKKSISSKEMDKNFSTQGSPIRAIFMREVKMMNRTPVFLLNGVLVPLLIPFIMIISMSFSGDSGNPVEQLKQMVNPFNINMAAVLLAIFACNTGGTASTTLSREGRQFWLSKVIPVSYRDQVTAKLLHSYAISSLGLITIIIALVVVFESSISSILIVLILAMLGNFALSVLAIIIDLSRPMLTWTDPQKAMKQNLNVFIFMLIEFGVIGALAFLNYKILINLDSWIIYSINGGLFTILSILGYNYLIKKAPEKYLSVEE